MKTFQKMLKWLLAGIFFLGLGAAAYVFERSKDPGFSLNRYRLTSSCLLLGVICLIAAFVLPWKKEPFVPGFLIVEDIFRMNPQGCVVVGYVKGRLRVNETVVIRNRYGGVIRTTIDGIEIFRESKPAAVDTPAALYFKAVEPETVFIDDIIRNVDDTGKGQ